MGVNYLLHQLLLVVVGLLDFLGCWLQDLLLPHLQVPVMCHWCCCHHPPKIPHTPTRWLALFEYESFKQETNKELFSENAHIPHTKTLNCQKGWVLGNTVIWLKLRLTAWSTRGRHTSTVTFASQVTTCKNELAIVFSAWQWSHKYCNNPSPKCHAYNQYGCNHSHHRSQKGHQVPVKTQCSVGHETFSHPICQKKIVKNEPKSKGYGTYTKHSCHVRMNHARSLGHTT
jgi:hypothetical protein